MKVAVIRYPGSNCDQDALHAVKDDLGIAAEYVWHEDHSLAGFEAVFIPGGFTYGDYLRCGAMAARAPIMDEVARFACQGRPVIGACNGFQILCEAGILPGALMRNGGQKFLCKDVYLKAENHSSMWTRGVERVLRIPIAHGEGRYVADEGTIKRMEDREQIAFRYVDPTGNREDEFNANGSLHAIAGVLNEKGNVLGLMPHPERATNPIVGCTDGLQILNALKLVSANL
ncbi:MAG TPA: phosphoribosylformylglycinamidine synthase subunit PurQ [Fimbriimonas sp.]|nr:phosphoribosylformylglycinamidine synthase subunit PurQ [Fimbriimonas sp.]